MLMNFEGQLHVTRKAANNLNVCFKVMAYEIIAELGNGNALHTVHFEFFD